MSFMCQKHKSRLIEDPESATIAWFRLIASARYQAEMENWEESIKSYGNALDVAEILFTRDAISVEVNRYVRTAIEFIYAIRCCNTQYTANTQVNQVQYILEKHLYPADVGLLVKPLEDVAYRSLSEVDIWMEALFIEDKKRKASIH